MDEHLDPLISWPVYYQSYLKNKNSLHYLGHTLLSFLNASIIKTCSNVFDLIKLEAICILLRKPVLCKQKDFDYTVSLFS